MTKLPAREHLLATGHENYAIVAYENYFFEKFYNERFPKSVMLDIVYLQARWYLMVI